MLWLLLLIVDELPPVVLPMVGQDVREIEPQPPPPAPRAVDTVTAGVFYVVQSEEPLLLLTSPAGVVDTIHEQGPIRCRGRWADADGIETRTLTAPYLYFVEPVKPGKCELLILRASAMDAAEVIRQPLTVAGEGPRPPPDDQTTEIEPAPDDGEVVPIPRPDELRVVLLLDESANAAQLLAVNSLDTRIWLDDNCKAWQRWDRSAIEATGVDGAPPEFVKMWQDIGDDVPLGPQVLIAGGTSVQVRPIVDAATLLDDLRRARGE